MSLRRLGPKTFVSCAVKRTGLFCVLSKFLARKHANLWDERILSMKQKPSQLFVVHRLVWRTDDLWRTGQQTNWQTDNWTDNHRNRNTSADEPFERSVNTPEWRVMLNSDDNEFCSAVVWCHTEVMYSHGISRSWSIKSAYFEYQPLSVFVYVCHKAKKKLEKSCIVCFPSDFP